ncbi:MAG: MCE family protein [Nitrospirae bacterium]|nr:MCE family protein [Nitrospirota bacterium]
MKNISAELKVGIFAIAVILILSYMTFKVGGLGIVWKKGYRLYVMFDNISGLEEKSKVKVAGVDSGTIEKVRLEKGRARLTLLMNPEVEIHKDAKASIRVAGFLGDKYLVIWSGSPKEQLLKDGDMIVNVEPAADIDALATELTSAATYISDLTESLNDIFSAPERKSIKDTIQNLATITKTLNEILVEDRKPLRDTLVSLEDFSKSLADKGPKAIDDVSKAAKDLKEVIEENRYTLKDSMENIRSFSASAQSIVQKIDKGEGTFGKLLKEDKFYDSINKVAESAGKGMDFVDRLRTFVNFRTEYLTKEQEWKGYFDITLQPQKDKYYIFGVTTDPMGSSEITYTTVGGVTTKEEKIKREVEVTAQFAKRFNDLAFRIGMLESTFGVGADYFLKKDNAKISLDVWDFSADEARAKKAHARLGMDYTFFKYFFVSGGIDNLLNDNRRGIYIGGGLKFEDEDLKYLFGGGVPKIPVQ